MSAVETMDFIKCVGRMVRAAGRRCAAEGDEPEVQALRELHGVLDQAIVTAVEGFRQRGMSWADIGRSLGIPKQQAHRDFSKRIAA